MTKPYQPIDCDFYDELVLLAMKKVTVTLLPYPFEEWEELKVKDLVTRSKEEFMVFSNGQEIRLDQIDALDETTIFLKGIEEEE
jgi:Rho-binding antiterminator